MITIRFCSRRGIFNFGFWNGELRRLYPARVVAIADELKTRVLPCGRDAFLEYGDGLMAGLTATLQQLDQCSDSFFKRYPEPPREFRR